MPSLPPAYPFVSSEYRDASRGGQIIAASSLFVAFCFLFTLLRVWARCLQKAPFMWADVFVPIGLLFVVAMCALCVVLVRYKNFGRHTDVVYTYYSESLPSAFKILFYALPCLYSVAVAMPKLAILNLYLHVFREPWARRSCYGVIAITVLTALVNFITTIFQCTPIGEPWHSSTGGWCMNLGVKFQWASFPNIFTDIAMLLIPIPTILKLQVPTRIKIGVYVTFLTGSIGLAASIARFVSFNNSTSGDLFYNGVPAVIWTIAEPGIYLIAACFITLKPLLNYILRESPLAPLFSKSSTTLGSLPLSSKDNETKDVVLRPIPPV